MDLQNLIEELEDIIENSAKMPIVNKCMIDRDEVWEIIQQFRLNYPEELKQANHIKKERERILSDARQEANQIIDAANKKAEMLVSETEILRLAKDKAEELMRDTQDRADELLNQTNENAEEIMNNAKAQANDFKAKARAYTDDMLMKVENITISLRDSVYDVYNQMSKSYEESESLISTITTSRSAISQSSDNE